MSTQQHHGWKPYLGRYALRISFVVLVIIILLLVRPALLGFKLQKAFEGTDKTPQSILAELQIFENQIRMVQTKLDVCVLSSDQFKETIASQEQHAFMLQTNLSLAQQSCQQQLNSLNNEHQQDVANFDEKVADLERSIADLESEMFDVQNDHERELEVQHAVISNAALNICCKQRVDDPSIDSYSVSNSRILCARGGEFEISC